MLKIEFELPDKNKYFCVNSFGEDSRCPCHDSEFRICRLFSVEINTEEISTYEDYIEYIQTYPNSFRFSKDAEEYIKNNKLEWCSLAERCKECYDKFGI